MKTIFISSTFNDMQMERDTIQNIVMPRINEEAKEYGDRVSFCDLRWGIDTSELESEESSKKVMRVCLEEIDRCDQPMIVILGDRYGWIPDEEMVSELAQNKKLVLDDYRKSITALEIEYGALQTESKLKNTLFYFRNMGKGVIDQSEPEDEEHDCLQRQLKDKIKELSLTGIHEYTIRDKEHLSADLDTFAQMLVSDIEEMLLPWWEKTKNLSETQLENCTHDRYFEEKAKQYIARKSLCKDYLEKVKSMQLFVLMGAPGAGKSTLVAAMREQLLKEGNKVISYESGLTLKTSRTSTILSQITATLSEEMGRAYESQTDFLKERQIMLELCNEYATTQRPLYIFVDAIDQIIEDDYRESLEFLPLTENKNIHVFVTCTPGISVKALYVEKMPVMCEREDKCDVISGVLQNHHRELSRDVIEKILEKEGTEKPLYLSFLIQRLVMLDQKDFEAIRSSGDGIKAINEYHKKIVEEAPQFTGEMGLLVLRLAARKIANDALNKAIVYIGVSEGGLRFDDLKELCPGLTKVDFAHFITYMQENFILREDGRYAFSHSAIIREIRYELLMDGNRFACSHDDLYHHFLKLPKEDELKNQEMIWHLLLGSNPGNTADYIRDYEATGRLNLVGVIREFIMRVQSKHVQKILDEIGTASYVIDFYTNVLFPTFGRNTDDISGIIELKKWLMRKAQESMDSKYLPILMKIVPIYKSVNYLSDGFEMVSLCMRLFVNFNRSFADKRRNTKPSDSMGKAFLCDGGIFG